MTKRYLTGLNRLKVIKEYLSGKEDPNWEVFPTRKEGKFIVKPRVVPVETSSINHNEYIDKNVADETADEAADVVRNTIDDDVEENEPAPIIETVGSKSPGTKSNQIPKAKQKTVKTDFIGPVVSKSSSTRNNYDPTISIEILNQLKTLGEEMRSEREAKKQKKLIKETVRNQIYKYPNHVVPQHNYVQPEVNDAVDESDDYYDDDEEEQAPTVPAAPMFVRRRLNLLNK